MLNTILGSLSSGVAASTNSYESIATVTVASGTSASLEFTGISSSYTHLQIRGFFRCSSNQELNIQLNSDTASNYSSHELSGNGATAGTANSSTTHIRTGMNTGYASAANTFSGFILDLLEYKNTNIYKTTRVLSGWDANGSGGIMLNSGNWRSTSAVTSIKLFPAPSDTFQQYSTFALYGIKGS